MRLIEHRLEQHIVSDETGRLIVVEVGAGRAGALTLLRVAAELASQGQRVEVVDAAADHPLQALVGKPRRGEIAKTVRLLGTSVRIWVMPDEPTEMPAAELTDGAAVLVLATVDPATGCDHLQVLGSNVVVMVGAGKTTADQLRGVGQLLRHCGLWIRSAILVGGERDDVSTGEWPDPSAESYRAISRTETTRP